MGASRGMSSGLGRDRGISTAGHGHAAQELPPLPDDVLEHPESAWIDPRAWFPDPSKPFELEIGSGKGTFLVQQAASDPATNYLGIEWTKEFYEYAADRARRHQLATVQLLCADATEFIRWRVPTAIVRVVHLYFSDPWPKPRHHKRRVVQDRFLRDVWRILQPAGELRIVTDHPDYWTWMEAHFSRWAPSSGGGAYERFAFERPASAREGEVVGTNFERKYAREGRPFNAAVLKKRDGGAFPALA
jgi:tRNA (guanine-N7-)-methyltransferase